jgi:hypothetical protein
MAERRRRREIPDVEGVTVEHGVGPAREVETTETGDAATQTETAATVVVETLPDPYEAPDADGPLTNEERTLFEACEDRIDRLRVAFIEAGQALELIKGGKLYREHYKTGQRFTTFEDYCLQVWGMSRPVAYRLIEEWRLAKRLSPMGDKLNERQVRALLPVGKRHGDEAAVTVYSTVANTEGVRATSTLLGEVVRILPADDWDEDAAVERIRLYLAGEWTPESVSRRAATVRTFADEATRVRDGLQALVDGDLLVQAVKEDPDQVRDLVKELRSFLDEIEPTLP